MTADPTAVPASWITEEVDFILSMQLANGAIFSTGTTITPWFANIAVDRTCWVRAFG